MRLRGGRSILAPSVTVSLQSSAFVRYETTQAGYYKLSDPGWKWLCRPAPLFLLRLGSGGLTIEHFFFLFAWQAHKTVPRTLSPGYTSLLRSASLLGRESGSTGRGPTRSSYLLTLCLSWARLISWLCGCETSPEIPYRQPLKDPQILQDTPHLPSSHEYSLGEFTLSAELKGTILVLLHDHFHMSSLSVGRVGGLLIWTIRLKDRFYALIPM